LPKKAEKNNIIFIGPKSREAIHIMGGKVSRKEAVKHIIFHGSWVDEPLQILKSQEVVAMKSVFLF
jgi:hypothetical protein